MHQGQFHCFNSLVLKFLHRPDRLFRLRVFLDGFLFGCVFGLKLIQVENRDICNVRDRHIVGLFKEIDLFAEIVNHIFEFLLMDNRRAGEHAELLFEVDTVGNSVLLELLFSFCHE